MRRHCTVFQGTCQRKRERWPLTQPYNQMRSLGRSLEQDAYKLTRCGMVGNEGIFPRLADTDRGRGRSRHAQVVINSAAGRYDAGRQVFTWIDWRLLESSG